MINITDSVNTTLISVGAIIYGVGFAGPYYASSGNYRYCMGSLRRVYEAYGTKAYIKGTGTL